MARKHSEPKARSLKQLPQVSQLPRAKRAVTAVLGLGAFLATAVALWDFYYACTPLVAPTFLDSNDPVAAPFSITNQSHWFTLYELKPGCIPNLRGPISVRAEGSIGTGHARDIAAGDTTQYKCPVSYPGKTATAVSIVVTGQYQIHLIPKLVTVNRAFHSESMRWWFDSEGNPHWLVGEELK